MAQTGGNVSDILVPCNEEGGCCMPKTVEGDLWEGFFRMLPVVPFDQVLQRVIGCAVGHLLSVRLGEAPALPLPVCTETVGVDSLMDLEIFQPLSQEVRDRDITIEFSILPLLINTR